MEKIKGKLEMFVQKIAEMGKNQGKAGNVSPKNGRKRKN
jgi:hypothetical protein